MFHSETDDRYSLEQRQEPYPTSGERRNMDDQIQQWHWPDDYVSFDNGLLHVRPDCVGAFKQLRWTTLDSVMNSDQVKIIRTLEARDNCVLQVDTVHGPVRAFLKRHRVRSLDDWRRERRARRAGDTPGMAEAAAVGWCRQAGIPTVNIIACGQRTDNGKFWQSDSFFLSEELTGSIPACDLWHDSGISDEARSRAIIAIARTARHFHAADLFHYDFYLDHFFVNTQQLAVPDIPVTATLMDLQRVERVSSSFARWRSGVKDLGQFYGSCQYHGVNEQDWNLWVRHYFGVSELDGIDLSQRNSVRLTAAVARWELRQWRRRIQSQIRRRAA